MTRWGETATATPPLARKELMTTDSTPETRDLLRRETLRRRDALSALDRQAKSEAIVGRLLGLPAILAARTLFTYVNFRSEVETLSLIRGWLTSGKRVAVPLTLAAEARLTAYQIIDPGRDLHPGYCRIPEPDPSLAAPVDPKEIEVILLPGSVFDRHGGRLGYGGGFYDRFIAYQAPEAIRIGLAFELQVTEGLPLLAHDQRLHALVTEERVLHFS